LLHVNDWTGDRSGAQMGVTENNSLFWQPVGSSRTLSKWARWPSPHANSSTLQAHRQGTGQGSNSRVVGGALPAINSGCGDYRVPDGYLGGEPLPNSIADLLGVSAGTVRAVGPTAPGPYMMYGWPLSKPTDEPLVEKAELNSAVGGLSAAISSPGLVQATRLAPPAPGPGTGVPSNC
jgi:hypothetical protein